MRAMLMSGGQLTSCGLPWPRERPHLGRCRRDYEPPFHWEASARLQSGTTASNTIRLYKPNQTGPGFHDPRGPTFTAKWLPELHAIRGCAPA